VSWGLTLKRKDENEKGRAPFSVKEEEEEKKKKKKKVFFRLFSNLQRSKPPTSNLTSET
jgi:hypothetical protein